MLIDTVEKLNQIKPLLLSCMDPCVDTETTGLSIFGNASRARDVVIGISIDDAYLWDARVRNNLTLVDDLDIDLE
jgi:hypothetical protein